MFPSLLCVVRLGFYLLTDEVTGWNPLLADLFVLLTFITACSGAGRVFSVDALVLRLLKEPQVCRTSGNHSWTSRGTGTACRVRRDVERHCVC